MELDRDHLRLVALYVGVDCSEMRAFCLLIVCSAAVLCCGNNVLSMEKVLLENEFLDFESWRRHHDREYSSVEAMEAKMVNFVANKELLQRHNGQESSWKMELNKFSDMSFEEFSSLYLMAAQNCSATRSGHTMSGAPPPEHKDWRMEGNYVTPVKNQGSCGSCWTFSTTGCLESATAIHGNHHPLYSLSEQQLVDCAQAFDDHGCKGGLPSHAFEYIRYNKGLMAEEDYPYKGKDGTCMFKPSDAVAFVREIVNVTRGSETEIRDAVAFKNPVSVAFQVTADFQQYKSGVYSNPSCGDLPTEVNHAVLAVGYGVDKESGMKYWLIKNSWGPDWGIDGYFMMERDVNMCGVAECASYPIV